LLLLPALIFAAPREIQKDAQGVTHFVEEVVTPKEIKLKALQASRWRNGSAASRETFEDEIDSADVIVDKLINLGKKMWKVIENGRPVVTVRHQYANALPFGVRAGELENFSPLQFRSYRHSGVNFYGATVYDVTYTLAHRYGGQYEGRGAYLESVTVLPQEVEVLWGYTVNFLVEDVSTVNLGSRENPIASIAMETTFEVKTVLQELRLKNLHEFRGDAAQVRSTEVN
jgi:hypothetical protein